MAAVRAMTKINSNEPFVRQVKDFIREANTACGHPKNKAEAKEKLWFDIDPRPGYWKISHVRGIKNPDQFNIEISRDFCIEQALIISRAILLHSFFRKSGRKRAQGVKFFVNRKHDIYTIERWPKNKKSIIDREEGQQRRIIIDNCRVQPDEVAKYCPSCQLIECKTHPEHQD
jgi:hypothetical protein